MFLTACQLQKLYVFGLYLHGSGKETGKFYEQTLDMCPLDFLQIPFISVQRAAYDAHFPTYHVGGFSEDSTAWMKRCMSLSLTVIGILYPPRR